MATARFVEGRVVLFDEKSIATKLIGILKHDGWVYDGHDDVLTGRYSMHRDLLVSPLKAEPKRVYLSFRSFAFEHTIAFDVRIGRLYSGWELPLSDFKSIRVLVTTMAIAIYRAIPFSYVSDYVIGYSLREMLGETIPTGQPA